MKAASIFSSRFFLSDFISKSREAEAIGSSDFIVFIQEGIMIDFGCVSTSPDSKAPKKLMEIDTYLWVKRFSRKNKII